MVSFSFRVTSKQSNRSSLFCGQSAFYIKMGKSHSRPDTVATSSGSNLVNSKQHSQSKHSVVSESGVQFKQKNGLDNGSRLASNTSEQTVKEVNTSTCEPTQAITNNANVNSIDSQLPHDQAQTVAALQSQNQTTQHHQINHRKKSADTKNIHKSDRKKTSSEENNNQSPNLFKKVMRKVSGKRTKSKEKLQQTTSSTSKHSTTNTDVEVAKNYSKDSRNNSVNDSKNNKTKDINHSQARLSSKESTNNSHSCHTKSSNSINSQPGQVTSNSSNNPKHLLHAIAKTPSALNTSHQPDSISYLSGTENTASLHEKQSFAALSLNTDNASIMTLQSGRVNGQLAFDANSANSTPAQPTATITTQPPSPSTIIHVKPVKIDLEEVDSEKSGDVTKSETKKEAKKETEKELKIELESKPKTDLNNNPELVNFRNQLDSRITDLGKMIESAQTFLTLPEMSEAGTEHINVAVGMAHLLITGKFKQFGGLCDLHYGVKVVDDETPPPTYGDLQGFWEMIYLTFENIQKEFDSIESWKNNDWNEPEQKPVSPAAKRTPVSRPSSRPASANSTKSKKSSRGRNSSSALREQIRAARLAKKAEEDAQNTTSTVSEPNLPETPKRSSEKDFSTGDASLANSGAETSRSVPEL